ncbi:MAG TPA: hypothetical protein VNZ58_05405 [Thermomicrobiales bacterium]|nr:hypothetical protein [Thermomicrobiales bacterium]
MDASRIRLAMIAWIAALFTLAAAWGSTFTRQPWNIVLIIAAIVGISVTTGTLGYLVSVLRAEAKDDS